MRNIANKSSENGAQASGITSNPKEASQLSVLFEKQLEDLFWAENALTTAIPEMIKKSTSTLLVHALTFHLAETQEQILRLKKVFDSIGKRPEAVKCDAMDGLIAEAGAIIATCETGDMCDAGIIAAAQKIEHYEIATYGTLRQFAETLGLQDAVLLLQTTLDEEKAANKVLTKIALRDINAGAAGARAVTS